MDGMYLIQGLGHSLRMTGSYLYSPLLYHMRLKSLQKKDFLCRRKRYVGMSCSNSGEISTTWLKK
jgi:hypothetical protein